MRRGRLSGSTVDESIVQMADDLFRHVLHRLGAGTELPQGGPTASDRREGYAGEWVGGARCGVMHCWSS